MEDPKEIIARNIVDLRRKNGMTQLELAEKLNYTDKAVSKWERGESIPDVAVLKTIADLFGVTVDYLLTAEHKTTVPVLSRLESTLRSHRVITGLSILLVALLATLIFVILDLLPGERGGAWLSFIWAVPVGSIVWLVFNSIWFNRHLNYLIISILVWSTLTATHITALFFGVNIWLIYVLGVPGQAIILLWSKMRGWKKKKPTL
ncbi:MAG: helix-turn-helix domain-containing protein [Clostridia bacterium]|nr:helix-turn-helix domain-containing protein [Clostridia bacterium]MDD7700492.1 helix-turn-helix transcriptional regulator [Eubacteriales bacterium]MDY2826332.1 helix-turn-helix transcriptional regulator [Eubacteriales bacterium]